MTNSIRLLFLLLVIAATANLTKAFADEQDDNGQSKAHALIQEVIKARGGQSYLNMRTIITRGQYTPFEKGVSDVPLPLLDYIVYPDKERTEFAKGDRKIVQTNTGGTGWIYEAKQKMIRDQTEEQTKRFQQGMRFDIDNVLRRGWQEPGAKLVYLGRREVWRNTFSEAVRLEYADGASVTLHIDPRSKLPMMSEYQTIDEGQTVNNQGRYFRWTDFNGIQFPTIVDFYREGQQTARVAVESLTINANLPDKLFAKPANIKEVK